MRRFVLPLLLILTLTLAACAPSPANADQTSSEPASVPNATPTDNPALIPTLFPNATGNPDLARKDEQGAVVVIVTPLNLGTPADTLDFDVSLNTHSVDLSMDLATLATLTTDTGVILQATTWDAPRGGHHVDGKLIFPATKDGKSILDGATKLTLTLVNVDTDSRVFEWDLQ